MAASGVSVMEFLIELLWVIVLYLCMFQMNRGKEVLGVVVGMRFSRMVTECLYS